MAEDDLTPLLDDPFATFYEWEGDADRKAYAVWPKADPASSAEVQPTDQD